MKRKLKIDKESNNYCIILECDGKVNKVNVPLTKKKAKLMLSDIEDTMSDLENISSLKLTGNEKEIKLLWMVSNKLEFCVFPFDHYIDDDE